MADKKNEGAKVLWLSEPTLAITLLLIKGGTSKQAQQACESKGIRFDPEAVESSDAKAWFLDVKPSMHEKSYTFKALWYDGKNNANLVHELTHLVFSIFEDRNIPTRRENDEIFAYHLAYWYTCITKEIKVTEL